MGLRWIRGLPSIGAWKIGALERGWGYIKTFGHTDVIWADGASQHMLVVLRNVDNAKEDLFAELACAYLPQCVRDHHE